MVRGCYNRGMKRAYVKWILVLIVSLVLIGVGAVGYVLLATDSKDTSASDTSMVTEQHASSQDLSSSDDEGLMAETPKADAFNDEKLTKMISDWAAANPGEYGVVVREATHDMRVASYQPDKSFISASTYKLFVTYGVLYMVQKGDIALDTQVVNGKVIPACLDSLLLYSSDECGWPMGKLLGWQTLSDFLHEQGFIHTNLNNYDSAGNFTGDKYSTATDEAEIAWRLNAGTLLEPTYADMMLSRMKTQVWRERIPAGVPGGIVVADKPGWIYDIQNDTAIVYGERSTYVLAIMSDGSTKPHLAELSKLIYDYLNGA